MTSELKILYPLATGTFGKVYLCDYKGEKCVVKKVPHSKFSQRVKTELQILRLVNHPRVIRLMGYYECLPNYFLIMEYASGGSLRNLIMSYQQNRWKLTQSDLINAFLDIAFGIKYLHSRKIIHRDLKPENVLIVEKLRLKIADFNVSKIVDDNVNPHNHTSIGTLCYMSPEVYLHQPYDSSCDIWALGIIFYELAMMKYPFTKADKARIMVHSLEFIPPKIDYERRRYEPFVQQLLEMMIHRAPKNRSSIYTICNYQPITKAKMYQQLIQEDRQCT